nr:hypothetical protein [Candidatus Sigynarchaeota archaeon]
MKTDNTIKLKDGRMLGFAEYGSQNGKPVINLGSSPECSKRLPCLR